MKVKNYFPPLFFVLMIMMSCVNRKESNEKTEDNLKFADEMVDFIPCPENPLFSGTGTDTWDRLIRERGYILIEDGLYKLWYSGYNPDISDLKFLGYATSTDGISWKRYAGNPIFDERWTEDMFVLKDDGLYYMFAERSDYESSHLLISKDGIQWEEKGTLVIFSTQGDTVPGIYGTPTVWVEDGEWYLYYELDDDAVYLAKSIDKKSWTNVQDEPVLERGPDDYDRGAVAADQVVKYKGNYYIYYHGTSSLTWDTTDSLAVWTSNVAISNDLIHWTKYPDNPIVKGQHSSPIIVFDGDKPSLYTMHPDVCRYSPR